MFKLQMLAGQDGLDESCATHWQEHTKHAEYKAEEQTGETDGFQQGQEQDKQYWNLSRRATVIETEDHNYRTGLKLPSRTRATS
jgi:hypothetical protein